MTATEQILKHQIDNDYFEGKQPDFIAGLAQRAVDSGYSSLSEKQRNTLTPHLTQACYGVTNPGGYHNECAATLEGSVLVDAYEQEAYRGGLLCPDCIQETEGYEAEWEKFSRD
ncbi:hypothetical protein [Enterovibrio nigricans]|uniref:Uncharacterized protein n=1 Tax=Enterovibrio nigricans DSM 22720 TaxID=1121868 RepID=A0A1T4WHK2_9GAMM|nr:hypothetical protein [Enterovibrio nigricans]PKF48639.1 hypothetical protein AT251_24600 [Enterovibrio nigricans]SKA76687.1 hypothetical protein SAMN02745132_04936 [Enterovibrio nigricans DSM 22720]